METEHSKASPPGATAPKPCVLAVDDQRDSLKLLQFRLHNAGMDCVGFTDAQKALDYLKDHTVDLIVLDLVMPGLDGYELCKRLKALDRVRDIPVLFLTANNEMADKVKALEAGGHDYLTKPVEQAELLARTKAALRVKHLQDELRERLHLQEQVGKMQHEMLGEHWQKSFGQLAASLAHEINNPLAAAIGSIQLLGIEGGMPPEALARLDVVDRSLQRASQKLRSLLLIAQTSRTAAPIKLGQLVDDILTIINYQIVMAKVSLTTKLDDNARLAKAPSELARALLYILNNSIEAVAGRPDAELEITLETGRGWHTIRVRDNGPGIPTEKIGRVQEAFFTTKPTPHHGVGLYLATEIVSSNGGAIQIKSPVADDQGTEVAIKIPAA